MKDNGYARLPAALQEALARCDVLAGDDQLELFYNLYDPKTGGFYHTISSRDTERMTPFAEATRFVLEALREGGMTLPDWYKEKVGNWILNHQDEEDGFFYEDLWGKITKDSRLYRDLNYSQDILRSYCGIEPKYPLPTERIKENKETAKTVPDYLIDKDKLLAYMEGLDWSYKMIWRTGHELTSSKQFMRAAGLYEVALDYIVSRQNRDTGLWGDGFGWMNTNGSMKLSGFFNEEHPYPNAEKMIESVKEIYGGKEPPTSATWIWNPFVLLSHAIGTHKEDAEALRARLYEAGADIVNRAIDCALLMKREDGGFSSSINGAIGRVQGYLMGLGLKTESDIDGTLIAGMRLRNTIHEVFGVTPNKDYYAKFNDEFWERIKNKKPIEKKFPCPDEPMGPNR